MRTNKNCACVMINKNFKTSSYKVLIVELNGSLLSRIREVLNSTLDCLSEKDTLFSNFYISIIILAISNLIICFVY